MEAQDSSKVVNVLWTGGYDSSFRMVQLSKIRVVIQPYYLSDNRRSEKNELNAIAQITADIKKNPQTKCTILPLIIFNTSEVKPDAEITKSYHKLRKVVPIGSQYDWLARFSKEHNLQGLELGIEKAASGKVVTIFNKLNAKLELVHDGDVAYYQLDGNQSDPDLMNVFGRFHYPSPLYDMTKTDTLAEYKRLGFEDTVTKTWFCFNPINNKPCGLCNPCKSTLSEGMEFRFPKSSLIRNKLRLVYVAKSFPGRVLRKLKLR